MEPIDSEAQKKILKARPAISGSLELTYRCNLHCQHCYVNRPASDTEAEKAELSLGEICRLIDEAVECGLFHLILTGGEPLLRPDFKEIYLHCKKRSVEITLYTNGTLMTAPLADFLAEQPPLLVELSLYGATPKTYEAVTEVKGSYERCILGIQRLIDRRIPLKLKTVVMTLNRQELEEMESLARRLGCPFRYGTYLAPRLDGSKDPLKLRIPSQEAFAIDQQRPERMKRYQENYFQCPIASHARAFYPCYAGRTTFHVDPTGQMTVCIFSRKQPYNLRVGNFKEAWSDFIPKKILSQKRKSLPCDGCNIRFFCGNCTAFSELETGKNGEIVPYFCERAHLTADALGISSNRPIFKSRS